MGKKGYVNKASERTFPPVLIFPEGTTTNGLSLLRFKSGGFLAGAPVQPVVLTYGGDRSFYEDEEDEEAEKEGSGGGEGGADDGTSGGGSSDAGSGEYEGEGGRGVEKKKKK